MSLVKRFFPNIKNVYVLAFLGLVVNIYGLTLLGYFIWMLFLDANNIPNQFKNRVKLMRLENEKEYYLQKIEEVKQDREELLSDPELLEKFAREKYLMRKANEDVYVIETEDEK